MKGSYQLAEQHGDWGYFGVVTLEVTLSPATRGVEVETLNDIPRWYAGALFGIAYAYEKSIGAEPRASGVKVRILQVHGHEVDTTDTVMAFVAAQAFFRAVGVQPPEGFRVDLMNGQFIYPK